MIYLCFLMFLVYQMSSSGGILDYRRGIRMGSIFKYFSPTDNQTQPKSDCNIFESSNIRTIDDNSSGYNWDKLSGSYQKGSNPDRRKESQINNQRITEICEHKSDYGSFGQTPEDSFFSGKGTAGRLVTVFCVPDNLSRRRTDEKYAYGICYVP